MSASSASVTSMAADSGLPAVSRVSYRPDIDGMRAVAAVVVVATHAGVLPGGFIGVDIFFVISGFLISGIILRALARGNFSTFDFYARRVKRIFPALLAVLVTVMMVGWLALPGEIYKPLGLEIVQGAVFVRDLAQYWERDDTLQFNLGHLWSLGIEEQFYLLWPLLLVMAAKVPGLGVLCIAALTGLSFLINLVLASAGHSGAYFVPLPRLWELSLGGWLALAQIQSGRNARGPLQADSLARVRALSRHAVGFIGAALIVGSLLCLDNIAHFPGWRALGPCLGAALLIAAGPQSFVNRYILSTAPMVFLGLISYPIYLWHYPLLEIPSLLSRNVTPFMTWAAVVATFILAYLTYRYVELPIRSSQRTVALAGTLCAAMLACLITGGLIYYHFIPARSEAAFARP